MESDSVWEKIKKGLKDGAELSMEKIEEYSKIGKLKIDEFTIRRKIERNFIDIGERVFNLVQEGKGEECVSDIAVQRSTENIVSLRSDLADIEQKISIIQAEGGRRAGNKEDEDGADE